MALKKIPRKIYYDKLTGIVLLDTGEHLTIMDETTLEQDIKTYKALSERNEDSFDYIRLEYGQYYDDFMQADSFRVDVKTKEIIFTYREINENGEETEITPTIPLSVQVSELKQKSNSQETQINQQEQAIAELTMLVSMGMMG